MLQASYRFLSAELDGQNLTIGINQNVRGKSAYAKALLFEITNARENRLRIIQFLTSDHVARLSDIFVNVHAYYYEAPVAQFIVRLLHVWQVGNTRMAPTSPKIEQNELSGEVGNLRSWPSKSVN